MQSTILTSDPTTVGCFFSISLPPADSAYINIYISTNGKQDVLKQPEANMVCFIFRLWVI